MGTDVATKAPFQIVPTTMDEAMRFADMIAKSDLAPKDYKGKPGNVLIAMQMGAEVGLHPMQAMQNIAVINGRPCMWGDALLAICQKHPDFEYIKEFIDDKGTAHCIVKRKDYPEHETTFSDEDAKVAGLLGKQGPWKTNPKRMKQLRARGFNLRDTFADALKGFSVAEEAQDITVSTAPPDPTPEQKTAAADLAAELAGAGSPVIDAETVDEPTITEAEAAELKTALKETGSGAQEFLQHMAVKRLGEIKQADIEKAKKWINAKLDEAAVA